MTHTLQDYRDFSATLFGEDSAATKFLDEKIAEQGPESQVIQDESQMIMLLTSLHFTEEEECSESGILKGEEPC